VGSALGMVVNRVSVEAVDPPREFLGLQTVSASRHGSAIVGTPRRRPAALFGVGLARSLVNGEVVIEGGLLKGSAPPTVRKVWSSGPGCRRRETLMAVRCSKGRVSGPAKEDVLRRCRKVSGDAGGGLAARPR
jgi:hypothetical protein